MSIFSKLFTSVVFIGMIAQTALAADKPLTFVFQKQKDPAKIVPEAEAVAKFLSAELGREVKTQIPGNYSASVQALVSEKADFAYVDSVSFLLARRDGNADLVLAEQRPDANGRLRTDYDSIFVVRKDSPLNSLEDVKHNVKNLRMVFTSPTSTSGYIMAYRRLVNEGIVAAKQDAKAVFKSVNFGGSYTQALEQVANGRGDICAVSYYTMEGESAEKYLPKELRDKLRVLARTSGVPTHVVAARGGIDPKLQEQVRAALVKMSETNPKLLKDVYGTSKLVDVEEDKHVLATVQAVEYLGLPLEGLMKKPKNKS